MSERSDGKSGKRCRSGGNAESGKVCRSALREARAAMGFSQAEAAAEIGIAERTLRYWESGTVTPPAGRLEASVACLRASRRPPGRRKREAVKRSHHLHWETGRGWALRYTLELNRKLVGKRVKIRLRTHCLQEAVERRELIVQQYRKLGFKVSDRRQRKRAGEG